LRQAYDYWQDQPGSFFEERRRTTSPPSERLEAGPLLGPGLPAIHTYCCCCFRCEGRRRRSLAASVDRTIRAVPTRSQQAPVALSLVCSVAAPPVCGGPPCGTVQPCLTFRPRGCRARFSSSRHRLDAPHRTVLSDGRSFCQRETSRGQLQSGDPLSPH
jgi:hypothetical protein